MKLRKLLQIFLPIITFVYSSINFAGDIEAGRQKASACIHCHGADGNSDHPAWPSLAGQQPAYLSNQLRAFRDGVRKNSPMNEIASGLSDQDIIDLASYFSGLTPKSAGGDPKLAKEGESAFGMCMGCHGATGGGRGMFPRLAGQQPSYLAKQLKNFRNKTRPGGPMRAMAAGLSDETIDALAAYLASLN
ncbi:MAG: c-type cytochrome [Gammaproteobacteria bacterium]